MDGERVPFNLSFARFMFMTLPLEMLQVIPVQLQWWMELFQELMMLNGSPTILVLKSSKALRSVSFSSDVAVVTKCKLEIMHNRRKPLRVWNNGLLEFAKGWFMF